MNFKNRTVLATLPRTQRGMPLVLGGDPKGKNFLYTNGNSVIIRDISDPRIADIYTEHSVQTTVAKYSPSGFYICSADISGKVRIWDTTQQEHILKNEFQPFVGNIKDLSWSPDNQRIVVVGEGRERFGHVFMAETGTSVGEISGHSNLINSCDFRPKRPFRIITGSEDNSVGIYEGPPFKFKQTLNDHTRFVQSVRYAPDGETFASGGFDGKMFLYNSNDYSLLGEFGSPAHGGGIYAVSWSPDGTKILSASGDKTCKLWDGKTMQLISEFHMGPDILDQQVSCLWQDQHLLSVSLSGFINFLDMQNPDKPLRIIKGHNKSITAMTVGTDKETVYTASHDAAVMVWNMTSGSHDRIKEKGHNNQVQNMIIGNGYVYTCSLDDTMKAISIKDSQYLPETIKLDSQPRGMACVKDEIVLVASINEISVFQNNKILSSYPVDFEGQCISAHPTESDIAVGGGKHREPAPDIMVLAAVYFNQSNYWNIKEKPLQQKMKQDNKVHIFLFSAGTFSPKTTLEHRGAITDVAYSPDGKYLAASDTNRKVVLYNTLTYEPSHTQDWCFHTARVNCISFCPNSRFLASGSLDTNIIIWSIENPTKHLIIKHAHPQSQITKVAWLDDNVIVSTGQDSNIKVWEITY